MDLCMYACMYAVKDCTHMYVRINIHANYRQILKWSRAYTSMHVVKKVYINIQIYTCIHVCLKKFALYKTNISFIWYLKIATHECMCVKYFTLSITRPRPIFGIPEKHKAESNSMQIPNDLFISMHDPWIHIMWMLEAQDRSACMQSPDDVMDAKPW